LADSKGIKRRINSITNTAQITRALQMVSAAKINKTQKQAEQLMIYSEGIYELVKMIGAIRDFESPYTKKHDKVENILILIIGPSRGFVGSLVANQEIYLNRYIDDLRLKYSGVNISTITKHKMAFKIAKALNLDITNHFDEYIEEPSMTDLSAMLKIIIEGFEAAEFDEVYVSYNHFINTIQQIPQVKKVLPIQLEHEDSNNETDFVYEPGQIAVLNQLLPEYFEIQILDAILESIASEHSSRMVSMKNATDNANELKEKLQLQYNRSRQSQITAEIMDIVGGSFTNI